MMSQPRVLVSPYRREISDLFSEVDLHRLHERFEVIWARNEPMPTSMFLDLLPDVDAVLFSSWTWGRDALRQTTPSRLKVILETSGSHGHRDLDYGYCFEQGIRVGSCAWAFADGVAEMALGLTLAAIRGIVTADRQMRQGGEVYETRANRSHHLLFGKTVGFIGCGGLSRSLQRLLEPFAVTLLGFDPFVDERTLRERGITPVALESLFDRADVVYVLAVPTPRNRHLISASLMERLHPHAVLCVMSRAHLVDFDAMTRMAAAGRFRVATDVFPVEPLPEDHPIRQVDGVVLSPHRAGSVPDTLQTIGKWAIEDLDAICRGQHPTRYQYATPTIRQMVTDSPITERSP